MGSPGRRPSFVTSNADSYVPVNGNLNEEVKLTALVSVAAGSPRSPAPLTWSRIPLAGRSKGGRMGPAGTTSAQL